MYVSYVMGPGINNLCIYPAVCGLPMSGLLSAV